MFHGRTGSTIYPVRELVKRLFGSDVFSRPDLRLNVMQYITSLKQHYKYKIPDDIFFEVGIMYMLMDMPPFERPVDFDSMSPTIRTGQIRKDYPWFDESGPVSSLDDKRHWQVWSDMIASRFIYLTGLTEVNTTNLIKGIESIGAGAIENAPKSNAGEYGNNFRKSWDDFHDGINKVRTFNRYMTIAVVTVAALATAAALPLVGPVATAALDELGELVEPDNLTALAGDIATDSAKDYLRSISKDMTEFLEDLDDKTALNLGALTNQVNRTLDGMTDAIADGIGGAVKTVTDEFIDRLQGIDESTAEAAANERVIRQEDNLSSGLGFAQGLKMLLFQRKGK